MKIGYMRVSTNEQNLDRQEKALKDAGCERVFFEKVTGTKRERPELNRMLEQLRKGDTIVVTDLTRLSRSTKDLIELIELFNNMEVHFKSIKESEIDTTSAQGYLMFTIFSALAKFERDLTSERTKEGLEIARSKGKQLGRKSTSKDKLEYAFYLIDSGKMNITEASEEIGVSRMTLHRYLKNRKESPANN